MKKIRFNALVSAIFAFVLVAFTYPAIGKERFILPDGSITDDEPKLKPHDANHYAFEGGKKGKPSDTWRNIQVSKKKLRREPDSDFNIPTNLRPSKTFGAKPFTQKMLRFEEFGPQPLPAANNADTYFNPDGTPRTFMSLPNPRGSESDPYDTSKAGPIWELLDLFMDQPVYPYPTVEANTAALNPWKTDIENFLGRELDTPPAEGRPPGPLWAHQRYDEFPPQVYVQTAQAGGRTNSGFRDDKQLHGYSHGSNGAFSEFGPGGLYHNTVGEIYDKATSSYTAAEPAYNGTTNGISVRFHPKMPVQGETAVFSFDGTFPPKLLNVRYGEGVLLRHYNVLPIDPSANLGFGLHTITTHEHNGHAPAESDGFTNAFFFPGQYYDYRWPIQLAGYDTINIDALDPRAGKPNADGSITNIRGDYRETMSTHWFHDHMLDFTAPNVYKGNAAMMNYYSSIDRGNEAIDDGVNLRLPSGTARGWGNRDYDVNLMIADKAWDRNGQLIFNPFNTDGFLGDRVLTNWLYKPTLDVRERRYRFRILNGSVSRYFKFAFVDEFGDRVPIYMIANDGNIMEHAVLFSNGVLPTQAIAERYDIIIDFADYEPGTRLYMVNLMEHESGEGPEEDPISLNRILSGDYKARKKDGAWQDGDPVVGKLLEFVVKQYDGTDLSMDPAEYVVGLKKMIPLPSFTQAELANAVHRTFEFDDSGDTDSKPWTISTDGGEDYGMDPRRISAAPQKGGPVEIWHLEGGSNWAHPIHVHFEEGQILSRGGDPPPIWERLARKDVYRLGDEVDSSRDLSFAIRFREFAGTYMEHCHNTQHEDTAMLLRWDIENPGQTLLMPSPLPTWDGVNLVDSFALATARRGDNGVGGFGD